jgi:RNA polymerase sigma-70 factor (ECF subfamily)
VGFARFLHLLAFDDETGEASPETASEDSLLRLSPEELAEELTLRYRDRLRYFAARRVRDRSVAEDVAQEVLRRTLEALRSGRVQNRQALPAFLFQTARHVCMQQGRTEGRKSRALARLKDAGEEDPDADPLRDLISEERRRIVRDALERLAPGDREVLVLSYSETLGAEEIGSRLNLTAGAVRVRRHRALQRLAELLGVTNRPDREL